MEKIIETRLVGREEVFKILALADCLQLPILLEGPPGTGKSHSMVDYAGGNKDDVFLVELDAGSKASEVKGFINMKSLLEEKRYETFSPICDKSYILINEVEKGSSEIRNTLLSMMQERQLQLGSEGTKDAKWKLFVGSCNSIPADERKEPFWDRFLIKHVLSPLTLEEMKEARKMITRKITVNVPDKNSLPTLSENMLNKFDELTVGVLSDRARIHAPMIARGIKAIWGTDDYQALCKVASFLCPAMVARISTELIPKEIVEMKSMIHNINSTVDYDAKTVMFAKLVKLFTDYSRKRDRDLDQLKALKDDVKKISDLMEKELKIREDAKKTEQSKKSAEVQAALEI